MDKPTAPVKSTTRLRTRWWMLSTINLLVVSLFALTLVGIVTTTAGAKFFLSLLQPLAGIQVKGISGSLSRQLSIQHVEMRHSDLELVAEGVELQWQPSALWSRQFQLDYLRVENLQIISAAHDDTPLTLPTSLKLPTLLNLYKANELTVHHLQFSTLDANRQVEFAQSFSALKAQLSIDSQRYQLHLSGATPWGSADAKGEFETVSPFNTQAQIKWTGLAQEHQGMVLPVTEVNGNLSGSWKKLLVEAKVDVESNSSHQDKSVEKAGGRFQAAVAPFNRLPIEALQVDLNSIDLVSFYADAPKGKWRVKADLKISEDKKSPTMQGQFSLVNSKPTSWNEGGVPIAKLSSEMTASEHQLSWNAMQVEMQDGGIAAGSGQVKFIDERESKKLPNITTTLSLTNINLLQIDTRLKKTNLNGTLKLTNESKENQGLQLALNLADKQPNKADAKLVANVQLNQQRVVTLNKMELRAEDAFLTAQGSMALDDKRKFSLQGEAQNLNPARWLDVPEGRVATRFNLAGQMQTGWLVDAHVQELYGQFAGLPLRGESDFVIQQSNLVSIKKLDLDWGKNHLSAKGSWQWGAQRGQRRQDQLQFNLAIPELAQLSDPFKKIVKGSEKDSEQAGMRGSLFIDGTLSGSATQPVGQVNVQANKLAITNLIALETLKGTLTLAEGSSGKIEGNLNATSLSFGASAEKDGMRINELRANLSGVRHDHLWHVSAMLPRKYQIELQANGDLQEANTRTGAVLQWQGDVQRFNLIGASDLQLIAPVALKVSGQGLQMGKANWKGALGNVQIQQLNWSPNQIASKGQLRDLPVMNALKLWRNSLPLIGDLNIHADWEFDISPQHASGQFEIKRTNGDVTIQDVSSGMSQTVALGLQNFAVEGSVGPSGLAGSFPLQIQVTALGTQLGEIDAHLKSSINRANGTNRTNGTNRAKSGSNDNWRIAANAPLSGSATLSIKDIQWMSQLVGSGVSLRGSLQAQAHLAGTMANPDYSAKVTGKELQVALTELGVLLPNGVLDADIEDQAGGAQVKLNQLHFSEAIDTPPKHNQLRSLSSSSWLKERGVIEASGAINLRTGHGSITTRWRHFPFIQMPEAWLVASGEAQLTETDKAWNLSGQLRADAAYFSVPKVAAPKLSSDVVVIKKNGRRPSGNRSSEMQSNVDFNFNTGDNFVFVGRGLDTQLQGDVRIRVQNDGPVVATGSIQTVGGTYEGYGQQLGIERGILNFQGALDNPTLNVRALRHGLPVEAGVDIVGTVAKPEVRLVSVPNVPDQDKLSWMILGRSSDQMGGSEAGLLVAAAGAIFGGEGGNISQEIAQTFGLDEISMGSATNPTESQLPTQTVAGTISNSATTDQVFSVGKRITPDLVFSIERSLTDATNGIKLTWQLTRGFSLIGRAGSDTSIDGQYLFSFN